MRILKIFETDSGLQNLEAMIEAFVEQNDLKIITISNLVSNSEHCVLAVVFEKISWRDKND